MGANRNLCVIFPGQGSQFSGMSKPLIENFSWTQAFFEEASDAIKHDLLRLCQEGPEDRLMLTKNAQPAILVTSFAWYQVLRKELDIQPRAAAGHSLGEYSALTASGALTLAEAARLVRARGELMQTAVPEGKGKMAAILGLDDDVVEALCKEASQKESSLVVPANFNAPLQVVIAGHADAVERATALAEGPRFKAKKVIPLRVSAPFHSPLMKPVVQQFQPHLSAVKWKAMMFPVAFNVDATVREKADYVDLLSRQLDHPVQWTRCAQALSDLDDPSFVEVGPGRVLTGLVKRSVPGAALASVDSLDALGAFERTLRGN